SRWLLGLFGLLRNPSAFMAQLLETGFVRPRAQAGGPDRSAFERTDGQDPAIAGIAQHPTQMGGKAAQRLTLDPPLAECMATRSRSPKDRASAEDVSGAGND